MTMKNNGSDLENKPDYTLSIDDMPHAQLALARVMEYGANKYERLNWLSSCNTDDHDSAMTKNRKSILRHIVENEAIDEESGLPALDLAFARIAITIEYRERRVD